MALPRLPGAKPAGLVLDHRPKVDFEEPVFTGQAVETILHPDIQDVLFVTGERGTGKTTFLLGAERPENVLFLDFESKGSGFAEQLPGITYIAPLQDCTRVYGVNYPRRLVWDRVVQIVNAIPENRFTLLIIDNGSWLLEGAAAMIEEDPTAWGVKVAAAASGQYGGVWPGVKKAIDSLFTLIRSKGVRVIGLTFQPKGAWVNGAPSLTKLKLPEVSTLHERSILTLALIPSVVGKAPVPSAVVLKEQLASIAFDEETNEMKVVRRLPAQLPMATMREVRRYLESETPVSFSRPAEGEVPDRDELERWKVTFSKDQLMRLIEILRLSQEAALREDENETE